MGDIMESLLKKYKRYMNYMFEWIFYEKIHGLDFTMRDKSLLDKTHGRFHGYSKTDRNHCKEIIENVFMISDNEKLRILDVGCGKGAFIREALKYQFEKVDGIEYDERLVKIARRNFDILRLSDKVNIFLADATTFSNYGDYNVFYFFNPFEKDIMDIVVKRIFSECDKKVVIILHNPVCADVIETHGGIRIKELYDSVKSYKTYIYVCECL